MKYIGVQDNIFCRILKLPLISSAEKKNLCRCGKKYIFTCPELNCRICLFKSCAENAPKHIHDFVDYITIPEVEEESNVEKDDEISVVSMYNYFYGYNMDRSKEVEEMILLSNYSSAEQPNTDGIE